MSEHHDNGAKICAKKIYNSWISEKKWRNKFISENIKPVFVPRLFPEPDRAFEDEKKSSKILMEFKPEKGETKRGIMTGLGQCIGYLNKCHASILVAPAFIKEKGEQKFDMGKFLSQTFNKFIYGKLPIALFTFDSFDGNKLQNLKLRCNIADNLYANKSNNIFFKAKPYWAWWRDWSADAQYKFLKSADNIKDFENRSEKVWDEFFFKYFAIPETFKSLEPVKSKIIGLNDEFMISFKAKKELYQKKISENELTNSEALKLLGLEISKNRPENIYRNYKKNNSIFLDQTHLWDEDKFVTPLGKLYIERVEKCENDIEKIKNEFAQILLVEGKHAEFIEDLENETKKISREIKINDGDYVTKLEDIFLKKGNILKNPNRTAKANKKLKGGKGKKFLTPEKQIWHNLDIIEWNNSRALFPGEGYKFKNNRIKILIAKFYENYGDAAFKTRKLV